MTVDGRETPDDDEDNEVQVTGVRHNPSLLLSSDDDEDDDGDVTSVQMKDAGEDEEREGLIDTMARADTNPVLTQVSPWGRFYACGFSEPLANNQLTPTTATNR
ncbi:unnamed protein product [Cylindrotheca closterium]|uniref:Uncharacterized protein n=1 Tax=Cylindrotheca closterium TaxID=2856 RepID=A0AAD2G7U6_9STRA|nr:unnamed protein product [Cylindrotheca closterium]